MILVPINRRVRARRDGDIWILEQIGGPAPIELHRWQGPKRSLYRVLEQRRLVMNQDGDRAMMTVPDHETFPERSDES